MSTIFTKKENGSNDKEISLGSSEVVEINGYDAVYGFKTGYNFMDVVGFDGSNYDTSKITSMAYMFASAIYLKNFNFSNFNTANVTSMYGMFNGCGSLVELDLSSFDTSKVTDMGHMFYACQQLKMLNLSNFDISNVTSKVSMFSKNAPLSKIICKQAFKDWCITNKGTINLPDTMINGTVGAVDSGSNWEIVDLS